MIRTLLLGLITSAAIYGMQLHAAEDEDNLDVDGPELSGTIRATRHGDLTGWSEILGQDQTAKSRH